MFLKRNPNLGAFGLHLSIKALKKIPNIDLEKEATMSNSQIKLLASLAKKIKKEKKDRNNYYYFERCQHRNKKRKPHY